MVRLLAWLTTRRLRPILQHIMPPTLAPGVMATYLALNQENQGSTPWEPASWERRPVINARRDISERRGHAFVMELVDLLE